MGKKEERIRIGYLQFKILNAKGSLKNALKKKTKSRTSLEVWWLGLSNFTAEGLGSISLDGPKYKKFKLKNKILKK